MSVLKALLGSRCKNEPVVRPARDVASRVLRVPRLGEWGLALFPFALAFPEAFPLHGHMALKSCLLVMEFARVWRFDAQSGAFIDNFVTTGAFGSEGVNYFWSMAMGPRDLYVSTLKVYPGPVGIARYSGRNGSLIDSFYLPKDFQYGQRRRPIAVGPDGNLYVGEIHGPRSWFDGPKPIWRFKADTGALIDIFVPRAAAV